MAGEGRHGLRRLGRRPADRACSAWPIRPKTDDMPVTPEPLVIVRKLPSRGRSTFVAYDPEGVGTAKPLLPERSSSPQTPTRASRARGRGGSSSPSEGNEYPRASTLLKVEAAVRPRRPHRRPAPRLSDKGHEGPRNSWPVVRRPAGSGQEELVPQRPPRQAKDDPGARALRGVGSTITLAEPPRHPTRRSLMPACRSSVLRHCRGKFTGSVRSPGLAGGLRPSTAPDGGPACICPATEDLPAKFRGHRSISPSIEHSLPLRGAGVASRLPGDPPRRRFMSFRLLLKVHRERGFSIIQALRDPPELHFFSAAAVQSYLGPAVHLRPA